jgi:hypothetical protein
MSYKKKNTASFGKRQEYSVIAELLKRNFDIYTTLVDDKGIDCIIRLNDKKYLDIQIKARSETAKQWSRFAALSFTTRKNFFFIFYTEKNKRFWVIPSKNVKRLGSKNKSGKYKGKITLNLPTIDKGKKAKIFKKYRDGFELLGSQDNRD